MILQTIIHYVEVCAMFYTAGFFTCGLVFALVSGAQKIGKI